MICHRLIFLMICVFASSWGYKQVLRGNTNFDNADRWSRKQIPCSGNRIEFDPNQMVSIFVQTNATITEITLPLNGEFIFDEGVIWGSSEELSSCDDPSNAVSVYDSSFDNWFNPAIWEANDDEDEIKSPLDLLDIEKVPCEYDEVVLPSGNSWTLSIPFDSSETGLTIWDKQYSVETFEEYRSTISGRYQFQGPGTFTSLEGGCDDPTGCVCRTAGNIQNIETTICSHVSCPHLCHDPLYPIGQCCPTCGALFTMTYSQLYTEDRMKQRLNQVLTNENNYTEVHFALSKVNPSLLERRVLFSEHDQRTSGDMIQILIRDTLEGTEIGRRAKQFASELQAILQTENQLGVSNVTMVISDAGKPPPTGGLSGGTIAGVVIGTIIGVVILLIVAVIIVRQGRSCTFTIPYVKFDKDKSLDNPLYDMGQNGVAESFENPLGESEKTRSVSVTGIPDLGAVTSDFGISFGNPVYQDEDV